jgi:RHS repeat-associated protein
VKPNFRRILSLTGTVIEYLVDGRNRRVGKKVNGVIERQWIYDGQLRPVAEMNGSGNITATYIYATHINVPDYIIKSGVTYRVITDHLGSLRFVINSSNGTIAQRIDYDDWGNVLLNTNPDFTPFGFAGGIYDKDTKLTRFGARDYDAEVGRWTSKDVFLTCGEDSLNLYAYSNNSPAEWVDPYGLWCIPIGKIAITDWTITETGPFTYEVRINAVGGIATACWTQYYEWAVMQRTTRKARICYEPDCYCGGVAIFVEAYGEYIHEKKTVKHLRTPENTRCRRATGFHTGGDIEEGDSYMTYQPFQGDRPVCVTPENK